MTAPGIGAGIVPGSSGGVTGCAIGAAVGRTMGGGIEGAVPVTGAPGGGACACAMAHARLNETPRVSSNERCLKRDFTVVLPASAHTADCTNQGPTLAL